MRGGIEMVESKENAGDSVADRKNMIVYDSNTNE